MDQARVDAVVADLLKDWQWRVLKDLYRDLRDTTGPWDASFALLVACRKARFDHANGPLPESRRWWRIFNRLNDYCLDIEPVAPF